MSQKLVFTLKKAPPGQASKIHVDAQGFSGPTCVEQTQKYLNALGTKEQTIEHKPEFNEAVVETSAETG